jgi:hypothetical protein
LIIHYSGGHGFRIPWNITGDGWDIPNLIETAVEVRWKRPDGNVIPRLSTSSDVVVTKASGNALVTVSLLVKPGDHTQVGFYTIESFDLTGGNRIPAPPVTYRVKRSI